MGPFSDPHIAPTFGNAVSLSLRTNILALSTGRHLEASRARLAEATRSLASGLRIERAADDPAGLAIADRLRGRVHRYEQGIRNVADAMGVARVADGALSEIASIVGRMRELAQQSATGLLSTAQRDGLAAEFDALKLEVDRIARTTSFNGTSLLDGSVSVSESTSAGPAAISAAVAQVTPLAEAETITFEDYGIFAGRSLAERQIQLSAGQSQADLVVAINGAPVIGALVNTSVDAGRLVLSSLAGGSTAEFLVSSDVEAAGASSGLGTTVLYAQGTDGAAATAGLAIQVGIDGSADDQIVLDFAGVRLKQLGLPAARIDRASVARSSLGILDEASARVALARSAIGASANRLAHATEGLRSARENASAAVSRIRDADVAQVTTELVREEILQQIATSLLAQANVFPVLALFLLVPTAAPDRPDPLGTGYP